MTASKTDLLSILEQISEEKRTGVLGLRGEGWSAAISTNKGKLIRVVADDEEEWRLGTLLWEVHILSQVRFLKALKIWKKKGDSQAETYLLKKGWVAITSLKNFQERLCVHRLFELASRVNYRASFKAQPAVGEEAGAGQVEIPVAFVAKYIADRNREALMGAKTLPQRDQCYRKVPSAIAPILGGQGDDIPEGAPVLGLTSTDRRVFFFCNGEIPFRDLALIVGLSHADLAKSIDTLVRMRAVGPVVAGTRATRWIKSVLPALRPVIAFVGGGGVALLVLLLSLAVFETTTQRRSALPAFEYQRYHRAGEGVSRRIFLDALQTYYLNHEAYPISLEKLVEKGHLSKKALTQHADMRRAVYIRAADGKGYRLKMGALELSVQRGLLVGRRLEGG